MLMNGGILKYNLLLHLYFSLKKNKYKNDTIQYTNEKEKEKRKENENE